MNAFISNHTFSFNLVTDTTRTHYNSFHHQNPSSVESNVPVLDPGSRSLEAENTPSLIITTESTSIRRPSGISSHLINYYYQGLVNSSSTSTLGFRTQRISTSFSPNISWSSHPEYTPMSSTQESFNTSTSMYDNDNFTLSYFLGGDNQKPELFENVTTNCTLPCPNTTIVSLEVENSTQIKQMLWKDFILVIIYCCIIAGTLIGNTLVIAAVITTRRLRTVTNCFVTSLAVADWLVGMFVMPFKVAFHLSHNVWNFGSLLCKIWITLDVMLCTSSILSLCTISIDRYLAITRPLAYSRRRRSKRLALSMISCVWVGSIAITSPPMFGWLKAETSVDKVGKCEYEDDPFYVVYSALGSFFVPLLVMLYVYARIACVIARRQRTIQTALKSKDKKYDESDTFVDDYALAMHPVDTDSFTSKSLRTLSKASSHLPSTSSSSTTLPPGNFNFYSCDRITKKESQDESNSSWNRLRSSQKSNIGSNHLHSISSKSPIPCGSCIMTVECNDIRTSGDIPSSSTLKVVGKGGTTLSCIPVLTTADNHRRNTKPIACDSTTRLMSGSKVTGSRLCNHNLLNTSPPINITRRVQSVGPSRPAARNKQLTQQVPSSELPDIGISSRIWTVEGNERRYIGNERLTRSTINLHGCHACGENLEPTLEESVSYVSSTVSADDLNQTCQSTSPYVMTVNNSIHHGVNNRSAKKTNRSTVRHPQSLYRHRYQHGQSRSSSLLHVSSSVPSMAPNLSKTCPIHVYRNNRHTKVNISQELTDQANTQQQQQSSREFGAGRVASFKKETKTAQTLAAVVGGFILCWLPFFLSYVIGPFIKPKQIPSELMEFFVWLGWGNSAINPAIYAFYNPDFRSAFWRLTIRKCQKRKSPRRFDRDGTAK